MRRAPQQFIVLYNDNEAYLPARAGEGEDASRGVKPA